MKKLFKFTLFSDIFPNLATFNFFLNNEELISNHFKFHIIS